MHLTNGNFVSFTYYLSTNTKYPEPELVSLLLQQNDQAFSYLYDNYSPALFGVINQIVIDKETAADVLQDVFVNIWKKIRLMMTKGRLFTWMLNIARNAAIDKIRSRSYQDSLKNQPLSENVNTITANSVVNPQQNDIGLKKQVSKLKEEYRS